MTTLSRIAFRVVPSTETNDHEVRFFVDGEDVLAKYAPDLLGLDPDDILDLEILAPREEPHEETIARCSCGVISCGDATVKISQIDETVTWNSWDGMMDGRNPGVLTFDKSGYIEAVIAALTDHSWETPDRTAARFLKNIVDINALSAHGLEYEWASGRLREGKLTISLKGPPGCQQILLHVACSGEPPEEVARKAAALLRSDPRGWNDVEWYGQLAEPPFRGAAWR